MFNVSLNKSVNIYFTFTLYLAGYIFLSLLGIYLFSEYHFLDDRFNDQTIFITHLFTIGFLSSIFTGSFFQLLPVLFGIDFKTSKAFVFIFILSTITTLVAFYLGLVKGKFSDFKILIFPFIIHFFLWLSIFISSIKTLFNSDQLNIKTIHLSLSLFHLILGAFIGILMILGHSQVLSINFRPYLTDVHVLILLVGFLISLIYLIAKNVIPMFFVAESSSNYGLGLFLFYFILYQKILAIFIDNDFFNLLSKIQLMLIICVGVLDILNILRKRKRKRKSTVINLWYLGLIIFLVFVFLTSYNALDININFSMQKIFFVFIKVIISAMIVKIIPFLFWLNLSFTQQKNMNYDSTISNINDFFSEKNIQIILVIQVVILLLSTMAKKWLGIGLIIESIYIIHLFTKSYKIFTSNLIKLGNKNEY